MTIEGGRAGTEKAKALSKRKTRVPAYREIEQHLQSLIRAGGGRSHPLPAEPELAAKFKVSRMTARQAYQRLVNTGVIVRYPGVGTFVTGHVFEALPIHGVPDFSAWIRAGTETTRRVLNYSVVSAPPNVARAMNLPPSARVTHLERLRIINGVPSLDTRYMPAAVHARISKEDIERTSLVKSLIQNGFAVASGHVEIDAHAATASEAQKLGITVGHPVLERRLVFSAADGQRLIIGTSRYPGGKAYTFRVQFNGVGDETKAGDFSYRSSLGDSDRVD